MSDYGSSWFANDRLGRLIKIDKVSDGSSIARSSARRRCDSIARFGSRERVAARTFGSIAIDRPFTFWGPGPLRARRYVFVVRIDSHRRAVQLLDRPGELVATAALRTLVVVVDIDALSERRADDPLGPVPAITSDRTLDGLVSFAPATHVSVFAAVPVGIGFDRARRRCIDDLDVGVCWVETIAIDTHRRCGGRTSATATAAAAARRLAIRAVIGL